MHDPLSAEFPDKRLLNLQKSSHVQRLMISSTSSLKKLSITFSSEAVTAGWDGQLS